VKLLAVETSCDDSAVAVLDENGKTLAELVSTQIVHSRHGGVVPEIASRLHMTVLPGLIREVLEGIIYLHSLPGVLLHNDINAKNIMLDLSGEKPRAVIIDFGHARPVAEIQYPMRLKGLDLYCVAPDFFAQSIGPKSDIFSTGALLYHLIIYFILYVEIRDFFCKNISFCLTIIKAEVCLSVSNDFK